MCRTSFKEPKHTSATQCRCVNLAPFLHCSPPRNSSSRCQSWSGVHAWSWRSAVRNTYSLLPLKISPSDNVCVCSSNPQCQPRNCAQGLNKGSEVKITSRSSGLRLCFVRYVCAHILVHTVTVDLLTATVFKLDEKRKVWHNSAGRLVFRANVKYRG